MAVWPNRTRISAACDRLATNDAPLQQIIFDVGYSDASSFSRLFKDTTGVTMGEYRKRFQPGGAEPHAAHGSPVPGAMVEPALGH